MNITGAQARALLDGTSPAPWEAEHRNHPMRGGDFISISPANEDGWMEARGARTVCEVTDTHTPNADLIAAAPDLAETVAWLYGREPDEDSEIDLPGQYFGVQLTPSGNVSIDYGDYVLTPDDAVELARALLSAAEAARTL